VNQAGGLKVGDRKYRRIKLFIETTKTRRNPRPRRPRSSSARTMSWRLSVPTPRAMPSRRPDLRGCRRDHDHHPGPPTPRPRKVRNLFSGPASSTISRPGDGQVRPENLKAPDRSSALGRARSTTKALPSSSKILRGGRAGKVVASILHQGRQGFLFPAHHIKGPTPGAVSPIITTKSPPVQQAPRWDPCPIIGSTPGQRELLKLGGADLEGCLFQYPLCPRHRHAHGQKFIQDYEAMYGKKPDDVPASPMSAGRLLAPPSPRPAPWTA